MRHLALAAALAAFTFTPAFAQGTTGQAGAASTGGTTGAATGTTTGTGLGATPAPMTGAAPGVAGSANGMSPGPAANNAGNNNGGGQAAASGNDNQAVATTAANASTPAKGANSFTMGQATTRIADHGYSDVSGLKKDQNGVWRGKASKSGEQVAVWLDYKGNVGQQ